MHTRKRKSVFFAKDFESNDGMLTTVWGPPMWHYLHTMSFNYPVHPTKQDISHYYRFIKELPFVLPCGKCRKNLIKTFRKKPFTKAQLKSRESFSRYMYELHEWVNSMLQKKTGLSYEDVRDRYEHFRSRCLTKKTRPSKVIEKGCTEPLTGEKSKCLLQIVPVSKQSETFQMDPNCEKVRIIHNSEWPNRI